MKLFCIVVGVIFLASCSSVPTQPNATVEAREIVVTEPITENTQTSDNRPDEPVTPAENRFDKPALTAQDLNSDRGEYFEQQSENQDGLGRQVDSALSAAEYYIQAQNYLDAERAATGLNSEALNEVQTDRLDIINAYVAYSKSEYVRAISILKPLWSREPELIIELAEEENIVEAGVDGEFEEIVLPIIPELPTLSTQQVDALLLGSFSYQALGDYDSAIDALITRERSLTGQSRSETTRYIWQVITSLPLERRQIIFDSTQYPLVRNRIEQSLNAQLAPVAQEPQQFSQWRRDQKGLTKQAVNDTWDASSPRNIAVLLPITSKFNKAAQAVKDGINYQHEANDSPYRPELRFYDIGDQPAMAAQYYSSALRSGADFIIGPLGKDYANQISNFDVDQYGESQYGLARTATLLLGGDTPLNASTSRFTLSPEMEGTRVAERAWRDGHLSAGLLVTDTSNSRRIVAAFTRKWQRLGGKISELVRYSPEQYDHSVELKQLFNINQSQNRYDQISQALGYKPKFSAYQRSDIDFILMIANTETGRLIRPQVNFFSGSKVPVYATSSIFNGIQDEVNNFDLDGTRFPVMPWVLKSAEVAPYAGQLNMLFALGSDAYSVAANYQELRNDSSLAINGNTGQVSIGNYGETNYQPIWATFKEGKVVPFETLGLDINPLTPLNDGVIDNQNVNGNYNDSTYNSQTWDKQNRLRR